MISFDVDASNPASPRVKIGGREQRGLSRVVMDMPAGEVPQVSLVYLGGGRFQGEGEVYVVESGPRAVAAFLDRVDPGQLERAALAVEQQAMAPMSPGQAFLAGLRSLLPAEEVADAGS